MTDWLSERASERTNDDSALYAVDGIGAVDRRRRCVWSILFEAVAAGKGREACAAVFGRQSMEVSVVERESLYCR